MSGAPPFPCPTKKYHRKEQPVTSPTRPELSAKGKSVLITGGGNTGIGGETARKFAEAGASRIALLGRREQPLLDNKALIESKFPGVEVSIYQADTTNQSQVNAAFDKFAAKAKIDVLIHAAAYIGPKEPITEANGQEVLDTVQFNVAGSLWVAQAFVRHAAPNAVAVPINSFATHLTLGNVFDAYCVAKIAVFRLWDEVGIKYPNLSVFHTQPGVVLTEQNLQSAGAASFEGIETDDPALPASFNVWLASPEARFLKGKFLWCNWDVEELKAQAKELESSTKLNVGLVGWPFAGTN
ncbi:putative Nadp-binding rossmann-fold containing [Seiridium unicorne]|uniref:Nadp-binding rossmann-fold containing n=1 Tax=Seiridium unicorne TaxID=138068 RepID=A0ABR2UGP6_9PEZI